jgi:hypothetical protein
LRRARSAAEAFENFDAAEVEKSARGSMVAPREAP